MKRQAGFTLFEIIVAMTVIVIIVAIAVPGLLSARLASNETLAIGSLRSLADGMDQFRMAGLVDEDGDGEGEFSWLYEVGGTTGLYPAGSTPVISGRLGVSSRGNDGFANSAGYTFTMYLPTEGSDANREGDPESAAERMDSANHREHRFVIYAWPQYLNESGKRAFVINQMGRVCATNNWEEQMYEGENPISQGTRYPPAEAAYYAPPGAGDIDNIEGGIFEGVSGGDSYSWNPVE